MGRTVSLEEQGQSQKAALPTLLPGRTERFSAALSPELEFINSNIISGPGSQPHSP